MVELDVQHGDPAAPRAEPRPLPERIGNYRILGIIASGGMGVVYEAQQDHPRRTVALKVMKRGIAPPKALERFTHEAEILGRLRHPAIAQVFEAGTHDDGSGGVPFFAMEYVPGAKPITRYADDAALSTRDRLELFAQVCDGIHHGHQKGIIHRDLKPHNLLVDETGRPKIIDFGVARATDSDITLTTMQADVRQLLGTVQYMSPEQCSGDPREIDTRSDIYSLGVVLYELLCGRLPYDLSGTPIPHATRLIQERDPPHPSAIIRALRGDVDAILLKALEKDPERRYQAAAALADDIRRHLAGAPIDARAPGAWSRAIRTLGRHPVRTTAGACSLIALLTVAASSAAVWYVNARPHHIEVTPDRREARLISLGGRILDTWRSPEPRGIMFAEMFDRAPGQGGGRLAVIGFGHGGTPFDGSLCAFPLEGDRKQPVWSRRLNDDDLPQESVDRGLRSSGFHVSWAIVEDIFPGRDGVEVVACYQHEPASLCSVRIFDLKGHLLYEMWHDGALGAGRWTAGHELLVLAGHNSEVYWSDRGSSEASSAYPIVVLAVRPEMGWRSRTWLAPRDARPTPNLAWYSCLLPASACESVSGPYLDPCLPGESGLVRLGVQLQGVPRAAVSWLLDAAGRIVPESQSPTDDWKQAPGAPDAAGFRLGDLPPVTK